MLFLIFCLTDVLPSYIGVPSRRWNDFVLQFFAKPLISSCSGLFELCARFLYHFFDLIPKLHHHCGVSHFPLTFVFTGNSVEGLPHKHINTLNLDPRLECLFGSASLSNAIVAIAFWVYLSSMAHFITSWIDHYALGCVLLLMTPFLSRYVDQLSQKWLIIFKIQFVALCIGYAPLDFECFWMILFWRFHSYFPCLWDTCTCVFYFLRRHSYRSPDNKHSLSHRLTRRRATVLMIFFAIILSFCHDYTIRAFISHFRLRFTIVTWIQTCLRSTAAIWARF